MKKILLVIITGGTVLFSAQSFCLQGTAFAIQAGVASASESGNLPAPGFSSVAGTSTADVASNETSASASTDNLKAKKKGDVTEEERTELSKSKKEDGSKKVEADKKKEVEDVANAQVRIMREARQKEMPYLDRMYIKTSITPLQVQKKEQFLESGPLDLPTLIQRAKSVHSQAKAAYEGINLYHRRVLYALRKMFPEISFSLNDRTGLLSGDQFNGNDWRLTLRQPLFNGGILWNTFLQEKSSLEAAKKQYDKVISDLIFDLSRAYFEYQRTLQTVEENEIAVEKMKRYYEMSQKKFDQKLISEIEYLNVQSLYSQMQFDLETARQEFEIAKLDLQKYLGLSVDDEVTLQKTYDLSELLEKAPETNKVVSGKVEDLENVSRFVADEKAPELPQLIDMSYTHRPELQVEAAKLQATRLGERIRWGDFLPKVFLTYEVGELGEAYVRGGELFGNGVGYRDEPDLKKEWRLMLEMNWNVGGNKVSYTWDRDSKAPSISQYLAGDGTYIRKNNLNIGVLDGLDAYVNVKQAEVDKLNQIVELEKAEKQVLQDVKQAFYDYQKALIQMRSTAKRAKWRERLRDLAEHRLGRKEVEISEFMQAETDLVRERADLHKALKDYYSAKAALNHAIGIQDYLGIENKNGK